MASTRSVLPVLVVLLLLAACASLGGSDPEELARTWERAMVWIPDRGWMRSGLTTSHWVREFVAALPPGKTFPLVLYVHGCAGLDAADSQSWAFTLTRAGYAMIAPDSFARRYRPSTCDPSTARAAYAPDVYAMRLAEIDHAVSQLRALPWVDRDNVFLLGVSEGGLAVALYTGRFFRGSIITAWTCTQVHHPSMDGLWVLRDKPVLTIVFADDPWFPPPNRGECGVKFGSRKLARSIVLPGPGHSPSGHGGAQHAVVEFLRQHTAGRARPEGS